MSLFGVRCEVHPLRPGELPLIVPSGDKERGDGRSVSDVCEPGYGDRAPYDDTVGVVDLGELVRCEGKESHAREELPPELLVLALHLHDLGVRLFVDVEWQVVAGAAGHVEEPEGGLRVCGAAAVELGGLWVKLAEVVACHWLEHFYVFYYFQLLRIWCWGFGVVCGGVWWCVVCGGIVGLLDVRGGVECVWCKEGSVRFRCNWGSVRFWGK